MRANALTRSFGTSYGGGLARFSASTASTKGSAGGRCNPGQDRDRPALCRDLARLAGLYGMLTGTTQAYGNAKVERELKHLRELGIDVHRPLTLRLLNDAYENDCAGGGDGALVKTLAGIGA